MKNKCVYCGANEIPHWPFWFYESLDILLSPIRQLLSRLLPGMNPETAIPDSVVLHFFRFLSIFKIASYSTDIEQVKNNRAKVLWEEAIARGIKMTEVKLLGSSIDCYIAELPKEKILFFGLPRPKKTDPAIHWIDDKGKLKLVLQKNNIPTPKGGTFSSYFLALRMFNQLSKPVIIKPRKGSRGRHTTTHIYTAEQFKKAFKIAKQLCFWVTVEEQLFGDVFRGTVVGGKLVGVLGGSHPKVIGDGIHTIEELISVVNTNKSPNLKDIIITDSHKLFLERQSLNLNTVLPNGVITELSEKVGLNYGGTTYEVTDTAHPDTKKALEQAAGVIGSPILGFDFIIQDITKSCHGQRWGIIECNGNPFINLHHHPLIGKPQNIAKHVWDLVV